MQKLTVFTTGGTLDKLYFDDRSDYQIGLPQVQKILDAMNVAFEYEVKPLMRKDSLHMGEADRQAIRQAVLASDAQHFLITHGTDTLVETAAALAGLPKRVVVLTGALSPARFRDSDAEFNIGCAIGAVQSLPWGVYVAMNGRIWDPAKVRKNRAANRFELA